MRTMFRGGGWGGRGGGGMFGLTGDWFDRIDVNHTGKVTLDQLLSTVLGLFDRVDANHDGVITPEEREAFGRAARWRAAASAGIWANAGTAARAASARPPSITFFILFLPPFHFLSSAPAIRPTRSEFDRTNAEQSQGAPVSDRTEVEEEVRRRRVSGHASSQLARAAHRNWP